MTILVVTPTKEFFIDNSEKDRALEYLESTADIDLFLVKRNGSGDTVLRQLTIDTAPRVEVTYETIIVNADGNPIATLDRIKV